MACTVAAIVGLSASADDTIATTETVVPPNIVIIYVDDLGYGDVGCYGGTGAATPHIDALATNGLRFTDGHAPAATCTPSRYALLTGNYAFRKPDTGIARGDATLKIDVETPTVASVLNDAGYATSVVGKWHLGLGSPDDGGPDWNGVLSPGPLELGFDACFLMPATGDRVPCVYVRDHRVVNLDPDDPIAVSFGQKIGDGPTGRDNPELLTVDWNHGHNQSIVNGISRIGYMTGGTAALWNDETMADVFTEEAIAFIDANQDEPFFLFFSLHDIHVPRVPHPRFVGATDMGPRGDCIVQVDWCVGAIMAALEARGLTDNTLVIFTSDNGPVLNDGYRDDAVERLGDHQPAGPFRGGKYSRFEAGTRVPFIVHWPGRVAPGTSDALVCQVDFLSSLSAIVGSPATAMDSQDTSAALLGDDAQGRETLVLQTNNASGLSLREGDWKYIPPNQSPAMNRNTNIEIGGSPNAQLYDLSVDPGEQNNLAAQQPDRVTRMQTMLDEIVAPSE